MISARVGGSPEAVRQSARHKLFVEGSEGDVIDVEVMKLLLPMIDVEPMGPSFHLKSVANALYPYHPDYYFLIDRDHHDEHTVLDSWNKFPDAETSNLLIWRKRELENYFLDPDYLVQSEYLRPATRGESGRVCLEKTIIASASKRLFMDVVNRVILTIREGQKQTWIEVFSNPDDFPDLLTAKSKLLASSKFSNRKHDVSRSVEPSAIESLFNDIFTEFTGGVFPLQFGQGTWRDRMSGKEILRQVISKCFKVIDWQGNEAQGDQKYLEVIKNLIKLPIAEQPSDFKQLQILIKRRVNPP